MAAVAFGIFDHLDQRDAPIHQVYAERLELLQAADEAGFYSYHIAEHHQTPLAAAPSPALFLAALARQTRRLRLGPLVYLLPMYNPIRLIEEIAMLDQLSNGRFDLGVGRGISPFELAYHGVDPEQSREIFYEVLAIVREGLSNDRLTYEGKFYQYHDVPMTVRPVQQPHPPLWYPTTSEDGIRYAARNGMNIALAGRGDGLREQATLYRETWQAHQHDAGRLNGHVAEPKIAGNYKIHLAPTDEEALTVARPAQRQHHESLVKLWHDHGAEPAGRGFTPDLDLMVQRRTAMIGSPATVRARVAEFFDESGCNYLIGQFHFGGMSHEHALRSLRLFVDGVMPAFTGATAVAAG